MKQESLAWFPTKRASQAISQSVSHTVSLQRAFLSLIFLFFYPHILEGRLPLGFQFRFNCKAVPAKSSGGSGTG